MQGLSSPRRWVRLLMVAMAVAACSSGSGSEDLPPWGSGAVEYFDELAMAYTANDFYGVLDYYSRNAFVEKWRGDLRGGAMVRDLLRWSSGDLDQEILTLHLGADGAVAMVGWSQSDGRSAVLSRIESGSIFGETVYDLGGWMLQGFRVSPDVLASYEILYEEYARTWSEGTDADFAKIYTPSTTLRDPLLGVDADGIDEISASIGVLGQIDVTKASAGQETSDESPAIYLGPAEYGEDPQRAVGVFKVTDSAGCAHQVAVAWQVTNGLIVDERRYHEVESFPSCSNERRPDGWWTGLMLPAPRDEVVTNVLRTDEGREIEIHNGSPRLEELLNMILGRFAEAGLGEPRFDSVTFEPSRSCQDRAGRLRQTEGSRDLFLCFYEDDLCRGSEACTEPILTVRSSVLHELAHAWILDQVTAEIQDRVLKFAGLETWQDSDVPWPQRGVEYSAEVITWGLLEDQIPMVRIGRPSCRELSDAYVLLTGSDPLRDDCQNA